MGLLILTEILNLGAELGAVRHKRQERGLDGSDGRGEREVNTLGIFGALAEAVLKDTVDDTADTEGRLDDVRHELLLLCDLSLGREADHLASEHELLALLSSDGDRLLFTDLRSKTSFGLFISILEEVDDKFLLLLELLSDNFLVEGSHRCRDTDGLGEAAGSHQLNLSLLHVLSEIEG